jgi:hypothetical protein
MQPADQQLIPQALQLIKDRPLRNFRIEVASDSLVQLDEQQMKQERLEFLNVYANFLAQAMPVGQASPETIPMMMELLKYGVGAFKQARTLEGALDQTLEQMKQAAGQPKPNPAVQQAQMEAQMQQAKFQAEQQATAARLQQEAQVEQMKLQQESQLEQMKLQHEAQMKAQELAHKEQLERWKTETEAATKIMVARIQANPGLDIPTLQAQQAVSEKIAQDLGGNVTQALDRMAQLHQDMATMQGSTISRVGELLETLKAPKRIIRGADGRAVGVESIAQTPAGGVVSQESVRLQ